MGKELTPSVVFQAHPGTHGSGLADDGLFSLPRGRQMESLPGQRPDRGAVEIKPAGMDVLAASAQGPPLPGAVRFVSFAQVVRRIAAILLLGPALDSNYEAVLPSATGLPR